MSYVDEDEYTDVFSSLSSTLREHAPRPIPKGFSKKYPHCIMYSMEESIMNRIESFKKSKGSRKWARRRTYLAMCSSGNCSIIAHTCVPDETKLGIFPKFLGSANLKRESLKNRKANRNVE
uniref:Uncharacterized protein n=1 Tax=Eucampia antarctica TaxID=49252 RepID=A0A7S2SGX0_9STRA|mmetsp:Transcript_8115/g.7658  ORF Transcript_8115/g.7658 Transcript_8115/m.7658 type:complete len:121 (+) Transcript_8115:158-520(+)